MLARSLETTSGEEPRPQLGRRGRGRRASSELRDGRPRVARGELRLQRPRRARGVAARGKRAREQQHVLDRAVRQRRELVRVPDRRRRLRCFEGVSPGAAAILRAFGCPLGISTSRPAAVPRSDPEDRGLTPSSELFLSIVAAARPARNDPRTSRAAAARGRSRARSPRSRAACAAYPRRARARPASRIPCPPCGARVCVWCPAPSCPCAARLRRATLVEQCGVCVLAAS